MTEEELRRRVHRAVDAAAEGLAPDAGLAERVCAGRRGGERVHRRLVTALACAVAVTLLTSCALAAALWQQLELRRYSGVEMIELTPKQWREYDWSHLLADGSHLLGGYRLEEDVIAPMEPGDAVVRVDGGGHVLWSLTDARLDGALFDRVEEAGDSLYLGPEQMCAEGWRAALAKVSTAGELQWRYVGAEGETICDFMPVAGGVLCVGSLREEDGENGWVLALNEDGIVRWTAECAADVECLGGVCRWQEHLLAAGQTEDSAVLLEVTETGEVRELARIPMTEPISTVTLAETDGGRLLLTAKLQEQTAAEGESSLCYAVLPVEELLAGE